MNREDIIRMAREAASKFASWDDWDSNKPASGPNGNEPHEEREYWISVVEFIAAAEREACAKFLERGVDMAGLAGYPVMQKYTAELLLGCAAAIRARSNP